MSVYIIEPVFTDEMVIRVFEHMVLCETTKILGHMPQLQDGQQDGYFKCLFDLFGQANQSCDEALEAAFEKGKSYLEVVDAIVETELKSTIEALLQKCNEEGREFGSLKDQIRLEQDTVQAVRNYFVDHADAMRESVRF